MPTVIETPGSPTANSYVSLAEADAYHDTRLHSTWSAFSDLEQERAVITATRMLDSLYEWEGFPATAEQALLWPRDGLQNFNLWEFIDVDEIPDRLKHATAELAWQMLLEDRQADNDIEATKLTSLRAGSVALTFGTGVHAKPIPDAVANLIPEWWGFLKGSGGTRPTERT